MGIRMINSKSESGEGRDEKGMEREDTGVSTVFVIFSFKQVSMLQIVKI